LSNHVESPSSLRAVRSVCTPSTAALRGKTEWMESTKCEYREPKLTYRPVWDQWSMKLQYFKPLDISLFSAPE